MKMIRLILTVTGFTILYGTLYSVTEESKVNLIVKAPEVVEVGDVFQVVFEANGETDNFSGPDFNDFQILGGPGYSASRFVSTRDGRTVSEIKISYTYAIKAIKPGNIEIGQATAKVNGSVVRSDPVKIKVYGEITQEEKAGYSQYDADGGDIFIMNIISNKNPYQGEVVVLTQKLYTRLAIHNIGRINLPSFNGFWSEAVDIGSYRIVQENYNGKLYNTLILNRTLLIPQRTGKIVIEPSAVTIQRSVERTVERRVWGRVIRQRVREPVENEIKSSRLIMNVKELPVSNKPQDFRGAVGDFSIQTSLSDTEIAAGSSVNLKVRIAGKGNLKLMDLPALRLPANIEKYKPEIVTKVTSTANGMSGYREYKYLIIPKDTGTFKIPSVSLSYFTPSERRYKQSNSEEIELKVKGYISDIGTVNMLKEPESYFDEDIRYIKTTIAKRLNANITPGSAIHLISIVIPIALLIIFLVVYRKRVKLKSDKSKLRALKAAKTAAKRLKSSYIAMRNNNNQEFFATLLKTLLGYISDKLSIETADLSKQKIVDELLKKGMNETLIRSYISVIEECEYAGYTPVKGNFIKEKLYADAQRLIKEIELNMK